jgi:hypothetical protein
LGSNYERVTNEGKEVENSNKQPSLARAGSPPGFSNLRDPVMRSQGAALRAGDRATATFEDICIFSIPASFHAGQHTKASRAH